MLLVKLTRLVVEPEQIRCGGIEKLTAGAGLTVIAKFTVGPLQVRPLAVKEGTMANCAVIGLVPLLIAVNAGIVPVPEVGVSPITPVVIQLYVALGMLPDSAIAVLKFPLQTSRLAGASAVGTGFTVMVKVLEMPGQLLVPPETTGVTINVAVIGPVVVFVAVNAGMLPVPDAANPIAVLLLVQLYTVPATADPVKLIGAVEAPAQTV